MDDSASGQDLQLGHWLRVLRRRAGLFALTVVSVVILAAVFAAVSAPRYEAEASVAVASTDADSATPSEGDIAAVVELAQSAEVEGEAQRRLGEPISIAVDNDEGSAIVTLRADARSPRLAARSANTYAEALVAVRARGDDVQFSVAESRLQAEIATIEAQLRDLTQETAPNEGNQDVQQLRSQLDAYESALSDLQVQAALASLRGEQIVSRAVAPQEPVGASTTRTLLIAVIAALLLASMLVGVVEYADRSIRDVRSTDDRQVLGVVPTPRGSLVRRLRPGHRTSLLGRDLVLDADPSHPAAEVYRTIRTMLLSSNPKPLSVLQVTSATESDGADAAVSAANLALSLALVGRPTVLLSLDFRHPQRLTDLFPSLSGPGFAGVLRREVSLDDVLIPTDLSEDLFVVPSGELDAAPADALAREDARELLDDLAARDEVVVILSPPVLAAPDAIIASVIADSTIVIARPGVTSRDELARAENLLTQTGAPLLGTLFVNGRAN